MPSGKVVSLSLLEIRSLISLKNNNDNELTLYKRNKVFQDSITDKAIKESDVVIGFDTSSWILGRRCKELGKKFVLDISIGHPLSKEKIYAQLSKNYPEWSEQILPKRKELIEHECTEMELADLIIVPSQFVKNTLVENNVSSEKIQINPFGTSLEDFSSSFKPKRNTQLFYSRAGFIIHECAATCGQNLLAIFE